MTTVARAVLSFELLLGGQCRLTSALTPSLTKQAYSKAAGYRQYLPIIPSKDATQHSQIIGGLMFGSGALLLLPYGYGSLRAIGKALALALPIMGVYSQYRMGVPYWLPIVNTILASIIIYGESAAGF